MRVLIVKLSSMGDVIHALPALSDAVAHVPGICFDWVVEEAYTEIPAWHPQVQRVIPIALRRWYKQPLRSETRKQWHACKAMLRQQRYNCLIDAQGLLKSAMLTMVVRSPSYGMNYRSAREPLASFFYQHTFNIDKTLHAIERIRQLFARMLNYSVPDTPADYCIPPPQCTDQNNYVVFIHGSTRSTKQWPLAHWQQLSRIIGAYGYRIKIPWGNDQEYENACAIASAHKYAEVSERLNLNGLASILQGAVAVISCDTGPAHLAAALGKPVTVLYGPTNPDLIGTRGSGTQIHLSAKQLNTISPEQVWQNLRPSLPVQA